MVIERFRSGRLMLALVVLSGFVLPSSGCTWHRNLLLRWHVEFDADCLCDDEIPESADDCCRCDSCSKLGRREHVAVDRPPGPTPAQLGHARFHPVPSKPVFPEPDGSDMADMGPPAPQWYLRENEPQDQKGRIEAEPSIPAPDLEEVEPPPAPMPNSGWDVNNS